MSGSSFFESRKFKTVMKFVYGWGGAVVIVGALFKILHIPGPMLTIGLLVEAGIFVLSAFEPLHEDPDWTLVYPELALGHADGEHALPVAEEEEVMEAIEESTEDNGSVVEQLDGMLAEAKIEPELIASLGDGLRNLSTSANQLGSISDASAATEEFVGNIKSASSRVGKLSEAYEEAATSLMGLTSTEEEGANFGEAMQKVSGNLSALNNVYEMQLKGASEHLETTEKMYGGINELMTNLHASLDDTKKYKETMAELSKNLTELNSVYGNMLSAMSGGNRA
ncbi:MAG: gliding motility protein GldL [Flavobacteriales bacterium]|jgi:gliding motility-associated protein GldL|nr:gliding motility protein GldL [Flavobacteriales bacterium]